MSDYNPDPEIEMLYARGRNERQARQERRTRRKKMNDWVVEAGDTGDSERVEASDR